MDAHDINVGGKGAESVGTRNLTAVQIDGAYKVAQYGQWDGYPEGQGMRCLNFARTIADSEEREKFAAKVRAATYIEPQELDNLWKQYGADDYGFLTIEGSTQMRQDHPEYSRDTGAGILSLIMERPEGIRLQDGIGFVADVGCEWAWVLDLDACTLEAYSAYSYFERQTPDTRFKFLQSRPYVHLVAKWSIDELPTDEEFIDAFSYPDDE